MKQMAVRWRKPRRRALDAVLLYWSVLVAQPDLSTPGSPKLRIPR